MQYVAKGIALNDNKRSELLLSAAMYSKVTN